MLQALPNHVRGVIATSHNPFIAPPLCTLTALSAPCYPASHAVIHDNYDTENHLGNPRVDWRIILKISLHEQGVRMYGIDSPDTGEGPAATIPEAQSNGVEINKRNGKKTYRESLSLRRCLVILNLPLGEKL
jgi:hypothetical protein